MRLPKQALDKLARIEHPRVGNPVYKNIGAIFLTGHMAIKIRNYADNASAFSGTLRVRVPLAATVKRTLGLKGTLAVRLMTQNMLSLSSPLFVNIRCSFSITPFLTYAYTPSTVDPIQITTLFSSAPQFIDSADFDFSQDAATGAGYHFGLV